MNYRSFQDVKVAEVGLGTWQLGSAEWGDVQEDEALKILDSYVDNGGTFIDTADIYGMGLSEKTVGKLLKSRDEDIYVATKLGRREDDGNGWPQNFTYDFMKKHVESSLENLGLSQLFLDQFHCIPKEQLQKGEVFDHFRRLQDEKLIRYWGASVETTEEALICLEQEGLASLQIIFNMFRQHVADELFSKAKEKGVALIIRVPLASGVLTGKFDKSTNFPENDHRNFNADGQAFNAGETFSGVPFNQAVGFANEIKNQLPDYRMSQWAIRWILDHPEVTTVIPGASKASQVKNNVQASDFPPLSSKIHKELRKLYDDTIYSTIRGHF
jgi:aryl-alcohol dehydrogenase-like predicted oxidoreductase